MGIYEDLERIVHETTKLACCSTARGPWEFRKNGSSVDIKYKGKFVILHNPAVSHSPTVCKEVITDNKLDYDRIASILSLA